MRRECGHAWALRGSVRIEPAESTLHILLLRALPVGVLVRRCRYRSLLFASRAVRIPASRAAKPLRPALIVVADACDGGGTSPLSSAELLVGFDEALAGLATPSAADVGAEAHAEDSPAATGAPAATAAALSPSSSCSREASTDCGASATPASAAASAPTRAPRPDSVLARAFLQMQAAGGVCPAPGRPPLVAGLHGVATSTRPMPVVSADDPCPAIAAGSVGAGGSSSRAASALSAAALPRTAAVVAATAASSAASHAAAAAAEPHVDAENVSPPASETACPASPRAASFERTLHSLRQAALQRRHSLAAIQGQIHRLLPMPAGDSEL